eukprot:TRINITY_DN9604_c0_g1_i1.p1 TRINITY_DN9604_c0_g1~~TRINITY_DN9604_c0_g1_i1.p1  ORF type:complete len:212 (-),score=39.47 TRINITY_DN9604_c0_g1_i1:127-675(-)
MELVRWSWADADHFNPFRWSRRQSFEEAAKTLRKCRRRDQNRGVRLEFAGRGVVEQPNSTTAAAHLTDLVNARQELLLAEAKAQEALQRLAEIESNLGEVVRGVREIEDRLDRGESVEFGNARTSLANLESMAKQLEVRIDDITTGDLPREWRQRVKDLKKSELERFEGLFDRFEKLFARLR